MRKYSLQSISALMYSVDRAVLQNLPRRKVWQKIVTLTPPRMQCRVPISLWKDRMLISFTNSPTSSLLMKLNSREAQSR